MQRPDGRGNSTKRAQSRVEAVSPEEGGWPRHESQTLLLVPAPGASPGVMHHEVTEAISGLHLAFLSYLSSCLLCFIVKLGWTLHSASNLGTCSG